VHGAVPGAAGRAARQPPRQQLPQLPSGACTWLGPAGRPACNAQSGAGRPRCCCPAGQRRSRHPAARCHCCSRDPCSGAARSQCSCQRWPSAAAAWQQPGPGCGQRTYCKHNSGCTAWRRHAAAAACCC
jgi:hypothetical protein